MTSVALLILYYFVCKGVAECDAEASWTRFATNEYYTGLRIWIDPLRNYTRTRRFLPKEISLTSAMEKCMYFCALEHSCNAINFYEIRASYACDLLTDNLCTNTTRKAYASSPDSYIWDKIISGTQKSCLETRIALTNQTTCEILRPGCLGTWPSCSNCTQTCVDCNARHDSTSILWPDGDGPDSEPIFGLCYYSKTNLIRRRLNATNGALLMFYKMSFPDMNRLYKLGVFRKLAFQFSNTLNEDYTSTYDNSFIDAVGNLSSMTFASSWTTSNSSRPPGDIFNLNGQSLGTIPYVTVLKDTYGCGSFWLLDPQNATYCPGGKLSIFGTYKSSPNISTGIHFPGAASDETFAAINVFLSL